MNHSSLYIFAGGGTGGHLYPGLAVAHELTAMQPSARIIFACSNRPIDRHILDPLPYGVVPQPVQPLPRRARDVIPFLRAWGKSNRQAAAMIRDLKPAAVLGLGGFAAGPLVRRAAEEHIACALLNPDAVPGKANQYLARHAWAIFTQFESTADAFAEPLRGKIRPVGCPIRRQLLSGSRREAVEWFKLDSAKRTLLVFGASLGASSINDCVAALAGDLDALASQWQLLIVSGKGKGEELARVFSADRRIAARVLDYCDRMDLAYAAADLTLCRGGASTVAELAATATPAVILPYPYHRDQQQKLNSLELQKAGCAIVADDRIDAVANARMLRDILLPLMLEPQRLESMRRAAAAVGKPHAARDIAEWLAHKGQ